MIIKLLFVKRIGKILLIKSLIYLKKSKKNIYSTMKDCVSMPSVIPTGITIIRSLNSPPVFSLILSVVFISVGKSFKVFVLRADDPLGGVDAPTD